MGKGTISLKKIPEHKTIYGNNEFHLRPIFQTVFKDKPIYFYALRPASIKGYLVDIEGEFGQGAISFSNHCNEIKNGDYKIILYVYYKEDLIHMSTKQKDFILSWATHGELSYRTIEKFEHLFFNNNNF